MENNSEVTKLVKPGPFAKRMGVSVRTVHNWIANKSVESVVIGGTVRIVIRDPRLLPEGSADGESI